MQRYQTLLHKPLAVKTGTRPEPYVQPGAGAQGIVRAFKTAVAAKNAADLTVRFANHVAGERNRDSWGCRARPPVQSYEQLESITGSKAAATCAGCVAGRFLPSTMCRSCLSRAPDGAGRPNSATSVGRRSSNVPHRSRGYILILARTSHSKSPSPPHPRSQVGASPENATVSQRETDSDRLRSRDCNLGRPSQLKVAAAPAPPQLRLQSARWRVRGTFAPLCACTQGTIESRSSHQGHS